MNKYIDAEKLKKVIEDKIRGRNEWLEVRQNQLWSDLNGEDMSILQIITSLQHELPEEPDRNLEEAARYSEILTYPMPDDGDIEKVMKVQEARIFHEIGFIAGAEWQKEQIPYIDFVIKPHCVHQL